MLDGGAQPPVLAREDRGAKDLVRTVRLLLRPKPQWDEVRMSELVSDGPLEQPVGKEDAIGWWSRGFPHEH